MNRKLQESQNEGIGQEVKTKIMAMQRGEITEYFIYERLSQSVRDDHNKNILQRIAKDELSHHNIWKRYTQARVKPSQFKIWLYYLISRVFGLTFGIKLMERGEAQAQEKYAQIGKSVSEALDIAEEENIHERELISLIDEERLKYTADMARGLNVALVELTGLLAGLTLALPEKNLILITGLIAGLAMVLSVASTEYLGTRTGRGFHSPFKAVFYGGMTNMIAFVLLIFPYFIFDNVFFSLGFMIFNAIVLLFVFSFYISVVKEIPLRKRFSEMVLVSMGVAVLAFLIGFLARTFLHVEI
ncbi:MAG: VIT1/CCC1 transporter family protein [Candidatus Aminicenantes bacterium]